MEGDQARLVGFAYEVVPDEGVWGTLTSEGARATLWQMIPMNRREKKQRPHALIKIVRLPPKSLQRLALGNPGDVAPIGDGLSELRIHYGPGYRVYFVQRGDVLIILLCGGDKRSQAKDIEKAKELTEELDE